MIESISSQGYDSPLQDQSIGDSSDSLPCLCQADLAPLHWMTEQIKEKFSTHRSQPMVLQ